MTETLSPSTAAPAAVKTKDWSIQSLRGIAVMLMVAGHVIGSSHVSGMRVADDSAWRFFYMLFEDLRMPMFSLLSGYVYGMRPISSTAAYPRLVTGKVRRLLIPLLVVGTLFILMQMAIPGTNTSRALSDTWRLYFFSTAHFWFLQAIFVVFLVVGALDAFGLIKRARGLATAILLAALVFGFNLLPFSFFSLAGAARLLPFFLLGYAFYTQPKLMQSSRAIAIAALLFVPLYSLRAWEILGQWHLDSTTDRFISIIVGASALSLVMNFRTLFSHPWLGWIGGFSFGIYLMHVFGAAGMRIAMNKLGIHHSGVVFAACLITGIALPILFELTLGRNDRISRLFLGQRAKGAARPTVGSQTATATATATETVRTTAP